MYAYVCVCVCIHEKYVYFCPIQVTIACDAILNAASAYKKQEQDSWEEELQVSKHARSLRQQENGVRIPPRLVSCKCSIRVSDGLPGTQVMVMGEFRNPL